MWKISLVVHPISRNPSPLASNLTVPLWMRSQLLYFEIFVVCNHAFSKWNFAQRMYCSRHWMPTQRRRQTSSNQLWNSYVFVILQEPFLIRFDNKELKGESTMPASSKLRNDWCRTMDRRRGHKLFRGEVVLEILYHSGIQYMVRQ